MRSKIGAVCITIGCLLLLAAVWLSAYNAYDDWRAGESVASVQDALDEVYYNNRNGSVESDVSDPDGGKTEKTVWIEGNEYIGTLSISRFGLQLPIMAQWSYEGLRIAPGRYSGTVYEDNLVICGHNYERHFGNLKYLDAGDEISFTDVDGDVFSYEVAEVETLEPYDIEKMVERETGDWDLTLFTCTLSGQARVTVRCRCNG